MRTPLPAGCLLAALLSAFVTGCGGEPESGAPEALTVSEAPTTLEQAFAQAPAEVRAEALEASRLITEGDYSLALVVLQRLCARPELTGDQRNLATRSMLTAQQETAKAAERGDEESRKLLKYRSMTK